MTVQRPGSLCALLLAVVMFTGCTGSTESPQNPPAVNAGTNDEALDTDYSNLENQTSSASSEESFDAFPDDIFIAQSHSSAQLSETNGMQNLHLKYPASDIASFVEIFHDGMKEKGWTLVTSSELPIGTIANFSKDDRKCTISVAPPKDQIIKVAIVIPNK